MAQAVRRLSSSLRALEKAPAGSVLAPPRTPARRLHTSRITQAQAQYARREPAECSSNEPFDGATHEFGDARAPRTRSLTLKYPRPDALERAPLLAEYLDDLFAPLQFPSDVVRRVLTHASHRDAVNGHNARFGFIGRRVLSAYMHAFLAGLPPAARKDARTLEELSEQVLNTYALGEHVAGAWGLGGVVRWTPPDAYADAHREPGDDVDYRRRERTEGRTVGRGTAGFYKIMGFTVEAVVGGVFHQHGGAATHNIFHTRILPHLLVPQRRVPRGVVERADELCVKMGGQPRARDVVVEGEGESKGEDANESKL